jgi:hypothetical protein
MLKFIIIIIITSFLLSKGKYIQSRRVQDKTQKQ